MKETLSNSEVPKIKLALEDKYKKQDKAKPEPLNPENIFCSNKIVVVSVSVLESIKFSPLWLFRFVEVLLFCSLVIVKLGKNSLMEIFSSCLTDSNFFRSALSLKLFSIALFK